VVGGLVLIGADLEGFFFFFFFLFYVKQV
jgi:hypothetical protein